MATKPPNINLIHPSLNGGASFNPIFIDIGFPDQRTDKKKANITPFLSVKAVQMINHFGKN